MYIWLHLLPQASATRRRTMPTNARLRDYSGPAILSYGFRPFFLGGAIYAGLGILIWLPLYFGDLSLPTTFSPLDWHIHEMLYGYLPAIITGFLLTAIPNWTGRLPLQGKPLAVLLAVWIAGRVAIGVSGVIGPLIAGVIDILFLALLAAATAREVVIGRNWRNLPPVLIVLMFLAGNVIFHVEDYQAGTAQFGTRLGIAAAVALISLIGGRVIPSFTRNWLARENPGRFPVPFGRFDLAVLGARAMGFRTCVAGNSGSDVGGWSRASGATGTLGRRPHVARPTRPGSPRRLCLRAPRLPHPRRCHTLSTLGAAQRRYSCLDRGSYWHNDARHHDARQPGSHRSRFDCRSADASHLRRHCDRCSAAHRCSVRTQCRRTTSRSRRCLDRGVLGVRRQLRAAVAAATGSHAATVILGRQDRCTQARRSVGSISCCCHRALILDSSCAARKPTYP